MANETGGKPAAAQRDRVAELLAGILATGVALPGRDHLAREWDLGLIPGILLYAVFFVPVYMVTHMLVSSWRESRRAPR